MADDFDDIAGALMREAAAVTEKLRQGEARRILERIDATSEASFADIAAIAAQICEVPISTITVIDDEKQYIKGMVGLDEAIRVLNRFEGVCNLTIQTPDTNTIIYDASEDSRLKGLPVVDGTYDYIKFYAGMPLVTRNGYAIGSMCVVDRAPRRLRPDQLAALDRLRRLVLKLLGEG